MSNTLGIRGYGAVEFYVGSAKMSAYWFANALGMEVAGFCGLETGTRDRVSYLLTKNNLKIIVTSALSPDTYEVASFVGQHGDGVKRMYYNVADVKHAFMTAVAKGADPILHPTLHQDQDGIYEEASIRVYDDSEIVFVNADKYRGLFKPGFKKSPTNIQVAHHDTHLEAIDHIVGNVREHEMDSWAEYFNKTMDFETFIDFGPGDISTPYSALLSKVVRSKDSVIKNPINEPYKGLKKSQIQEYLEHYHGSGIQHIAISTSNIIESIRSLRKNGVTFLSVPKTYYNALRDKKPAIKENIDDLEALGILCDLEDMAGKGYLLQLFTKPIGDRPTFFFEIIQRCEGSQGFGHGNFQALFESIERDQAERGNL